MSDVEIKPQGGGAMNRSPSARSEAQDTWLTGAKRHLGNESLVLLVPVTIGIIGLGIFTATQSEVFLTRQNLLTVLIQASPLGIISVGMTLLMVTGLLDVSVGAVASFSAVIAANMYVGGSAAVVIVIAALAVAAGVGALFGVVVAVTRVEVFIFTLGGMSVFTAFALVAAGGRPVPTGDFLTGLALNKLLGIPFPVLTMVVVAVAGVLLLRYTRLGRNAYAIGSNEEAAFVAGVPVVRVKVILFTISGLLVGVAAIVLLARLGAGDPRAGIGLELQAIAAVILGGGALSGGRGSILGTLLGVVLLAEVQNALVVLNVDSAYQTAFQGGILMAAVLFIALNSRSRSGQGKRRLRRNPKTGRTEPQ